MAWNNIPSPGALLGSALGVVKPGAISGAALGAMAPTVVPTVNQMSTPTVNQTSSNSHAASINSAADAIGQITANAQANNAWSADQARIQREWQEQQNAKAMAFNQSEAEKTRNWQEMMSNTAHQREIADLKAAGLNPVLSAMGGNGAAVTSGATASGVTSSGAMGQTDTSLNSALVNLLGSIYNRTTQLEMANINARTQESVAEMYTEMSRIVANINSDSSKYNTDRNVENPSTLYGLIGRLGKVLGSAVSTVSGISDDSDYLYRWRDN